MNILKPLRPSGLLSEEEALRDLEDIPMVRETSSPIPSGKDTGNIILDCHAAEKGDRRTQDEWIEYWNKSDRVMASMADYYQYFKQLKGNNDEDKVKTLLTSLREDFDHQEKGNWLISSTRLVYSKDNLDARIIQHYGFARDELVKEAEIKVPVYRGTPVTQVVSEGEGLAYLQTLFGTEDEGEEIIQILEFVSDRNRDVIKVWTAAVEDAYTRSQYPSRAAGFDYGNDIFHVGGDDGLGSQGRSRGVIYPRSGATKK